MDVASGGKMAAAAPGIKEVFQVGSRGRGNTNISFFYKKGTSFPRPLSEDFTLCHIG
jgi:hypothetical protein